MAREYFYVCDTGLGRKKFVQKTLFSALKKTPGFKNGSNEGDTTQPRRHSTRPGGHFMHKLVGWNYQSQDWSEGGLSDA